jgi:hypothetical protein
MQAIPIQGVKCIVCQNPRYFQVVSILSVVKLKDCPPTMKEYAIYGRYVVKIISGGNSISFYFVQFVWRTRSRWAE